MALTESERKFYTDLLYADVILETLKNDDKGEITLNNATLHSTRTMIKNAILRLETKDNNDTIRIRAQMEERDII